MPRSTAATRKHRIPECYPARRFWSEFNQSHAKWKIACIATAFAEYRQHGERIYTDALRVLAEAWEGDINSLRSEVLQGVARFVALYDHEYDPIRLIKQLKRISPLTIYRSGQAMSGPNYQKYMHQILRSTTAPAVLGAFLSSSDVLS